MLRPYCKAGTVHHVPDIAPPTAVISHSGFRRGASRRLSECKAQCSHGRWLPRLEREFGWKDDTALNFMRVPEMVKSRKFSGFEYRRVIPLPAYRTEHAGRSAASHGGRPFSFQALALDDVDLGPVGFRHALQFGAYCGV